MENPAEAQIVSELTLKATEPLQVEAGEAYLVRTLAGKPELVRFNSDEDLYRAGMNPVGRRGLAKLSDVASLVAYVGIHQTDSTAIYASRSDSCITVVLDEQPGWGVHRANLSLQFSSQWRNWNAVNGDLVSQSEFAEFLDDNIADIREPSAADMLEVAQSIYGTVGASIRSAQRLDNGQVQLSYEEVVDATAGKNGSLSIPRRLLLGLPVYEEGKVYAVGAAFRYRLGNSKVVMGVKLDQPELFIRTAFNDAVQALQAALVEAGISVPLLRGVAPNARI